MNVYACPTADKRGYVAHLLDTYKKDLIYVTDVRQVYNALAMNYTVVNDTRTNKFRDDQQLYSRIVMDVIAQLNATRLVLHDWFAKELINSIDLFFMHTESDAEKILRMTVPNGVERASDLARLHDTWVLLLDRAPEKIITMEYGDRLEHFFEPIEADGILQMRLKQDKVSVQRNRRQGSRERDALMRLIL